MRFPGDPEGHLAGGMVRIDRREDKKMEDKKSAPTDSERSSDREEVRRSRAHRGAPSAVAALIVSVFALLHSLWSENTSRECEFSYTAYDRIAELGSRIQQENIRIQESFQRIARLGSEERTSSLLNDTVAQFVDRITIYSTLLRLDQIAFNESEIDAMEERRDGIYREFDRLRSTENNAEQLQTFVASTQDSWNAIQNMVDDGVERVAHQIRDRCR